MVRQRRTIFLNDYDEVVQKPTNDEEEGQSEIFLEEAPTCSGCLG
jgi:hypothetical protein